jgi:hypothetical protein
MNNRDLYRSTFSRVHASGGMTMEDIMNRKKKTPRASRRLVTVFAMVILVLAMGITVNAATGGAIASYFDKLLGIEQTMQITEEGSDPLEIYMSDLDIGIYDADQNMIEDLNMKDAEDIHFDKGSQTAEIDGTTYHVILLLDVDEETTDNATHGQLRLYTPEDYAKAMETLVVPDGMYCPSIQL